MHCNIYECTIKELEIFWKEKQCITVQEEVWVFKVEPSRDICVHREITNLNNDASESVCHVSRVPLQPCSVVELTRNVHSESVLINLLTAMTKLAKHQQIVGRTLAL